MTNYLSKSVSVALVVSGMLVGGAVTFAQDAAQETDTQVNANLGITFPIAELGNCADKDACKAYCDEGAHMTECVAFAEAHGLMNKEEASKAKKFAGELSGKGGPGGCTSPKECKAYCDDVTHLDACVAFADEHGLSGEGAANGKKLNTYLKSGGTMPGGCMSHDTCKAYCSDFTHAEECDAFQQKAGITPPNGSAGEKGGGRDGKSPNGKLQPKLASDKLKLLSELAAKGETPGACTTKDTCQAYCKDTAHTEECVAFGEKMGFLSKEDATRAKEFRTTGGPGGCKSAEECKAFCNDEANRETCFAFAKEHNLMPEGDIDQMKDGWVRVRAGLDNAPEEVRACITTALGEKGITDIESGKTVPGSAVGLEVKTCFEKFGGEKDPTKVLTQAPPEVTTCLKEKLGDAYTELGSGKTTPTPETADAFRTCFQSMQMKNGAWGQGGAPGPNGQQGATGGKPQGMGAPSPEMIKRMVAGAPTEVRSCLETALGADPAALEAGTLTVTDDTKTKMKSCFEQFRPTTMQSGIQTGMQQGMQNGIQGGLQQGIQNGIQNGIQGGMQQGIQGGMQSGLQGGAPQIPPAVVACVKEAIGEEKFATLTKERPSVEVQAIMRSCVEKYGKPMMNMDGTMPAGQGGTQTGTGMKMPIPSGGTSGTQTGMPQPMMPQGGTTNTGVRPPMNLPVQLQACLKSKIGEEAFAKLATTGPTAEAQTAMKACAMELQSSGQLPVPGMTNTAPTGDGMMKPPMNGGMMMPPPNTTGGTMPTPQEPPKEAASAGNHSFAATVFLSLWDILSR